MVNRIQLSSKRTFLSNSTLTFGHKQSFVHWTTKTYMEVEVFRVLVAAQVRDYTTRTMLKVRQRRNVFFRDHHHMDWTRRLGVMESEDIIGFGHDIDRSSPTQRFVAIEITH